MQYAWLIWSLISIGIWTVIYVILGSRNKRREMLVVSLWTSLLGLTEPLFVPKYWVPPSLFSLAMRTGFDIESFIFSFAIGGVAVIIYEKIFRITHARIPVQSQHTLRHRFHFWALFSAPIIFIFLLLTTSLNPIHISVIALILSGFATWYCRPDLKKKMIVSGFLFLILYFFYFLTLIAMYPGYVEKVWQLNHISGILVAGVPLEELMFAFSFGFLWSSIYEHFTWRKITII